MPFIDTHMHADVFAAEGSVDDVFARARAAQVERIVAIGGSAAANALALTLARRHAALVRATIGLDRDEIGRPMDTRLLLDQAADPLCAAVGEIGLDYHYGADTRAEQCDLFDAMLHLAAEVRRPVVIHSREADDDTVQLLREYLARPGVDAARPGVLHCFTGSAPFARRLLDLGFFISFSGILTFKNAANLREVARMVPADRLLVETDAPYLAPIPFRGKRNEPAWVVHVAEALASERAVSLQPLAQQVWDNAQRLFAWQVYQG
ncbi:MAG TPA: TatD family hydrolase [Kiritimatiellia bacterium]|nr:TatD family hydrolase [Kiritimatiellia bacterium]